MPVSARILENTAAAGHYLTCGKAAYLWLGPAFGRLGARRGRGGRGPGRRRRRCHARRHGGGLPPQQPLQVQPVLWPAGPQIQIPAPIILG